MDTKKCLVTGGAGFIGHHLVRSLLDAGHAVTVLDDLSTGKREHLDSRATFWEGSILDIQEKKESKTVPFWKKYLRSEKQAYDLSGFDWIFHLAAVPRVPVSWNEPERTAQVNVMGTLRLLLAAEAAKVQRFVYASSSSVYGDQEVMPLTEDMQQRPKSPYAVQKLAGEQFVTAYGKRGGIHTTSLRLFNVYGHGQDAASPYSGVLSLWKANRLAGLPPIVHGDGLQARDFTHVSDVVGALMTAAYANTPSGEVYNVANGSSVSLLEAVGHFSKVYVSAPERVGDVKRTCGSPLKAKNGLGFTCTVSFESGIADLTGDLPPLTDKDFVSGHQLFSRVA